MSRFKIALITLLIVAVISFFIFDLQQLFSLDLFNQQKQHIFDYYEARPIQSAIVYFVLYIVLASLSLPGAVLMTLVGGAVFGFWWGLLLVSFASSIGATLAFAVARFLLRDWVQLRFAKPLQGVNQGIEKDGAFYLFALRLVPLFPFFIINLVMGLTPLKVVTFYWVSQVGMLASTAVYVNAGTRLAQVSSFGDILSPGLILSFVLLGFFPLLAKKILALIGRQR